VYLKVMLAGMLVFNVRGAQQQQAEDLSPLSCGAAVHQHHVGAAAGGGPQWPAARARAHMVARCAQDASVKCHIFAPDGRSVGLAR
jgi:hypothetical protein